MPRISVSVSLSLVLLGLCGCAGTRPEVHAYAPPTGAECGVVFSVDGAGGYQATSAALAHAVADAGLPLRVEPVVWSHGHGRFIADQVDYGHARAEGRCLAEKVAAYRAARPTAAVYLVGHSAGSAVALAAVEELPPGTVDQVVLLAPSVSADYDLRPALARVRAIEVFCSRRDWVFLGVGTSLVGTADRRWSAAGGRVGFRPVGETPADLALYARLHQHPWDPCLAWTGNHGGHYDAYQPGYLRAYVLPLLGPPHQTACR